MLLQQCLSLNFFAFNELRNAKLHFRCVETSFVLIGIVGVGYQVVGVIFLFLLFFAGRLQFNAHKNASGFVCFLILGPLCVGGSDSEVIFFLFPSFIYSARSVYHFISFLFFFLFVNVCLYYSMIWFFCIYQIVEDEIKKTSQFRVTKKNFEYIYMFKCVVRCYYVVHIS